MIVFNLPHLRSLLACFCSKTNRQTDSGRCNTRYWWDFAAFSRPIFYHNFFSPFFCSALQFLTLYTSLHFLSHFSQSLILIIPRISTAWPGFRCHSFKSNNFSATSFGHPCECYKNITQVDVLHKYNFPQQFRLMESKDKHPRWWGPDSKWWQTRNSLMETQNIKPVP